MSCSGVHDKVYYGSVIQILQTLSYGARGEQRVGNGSAKAKDE